LTGDAARRLLRSCQEALQGWDPPTTFQDRLRRDYLDHLSRHPDGWARTCGGAHLTASSLVCEPGSGRVLLTLHKKIGRWLQTGGHLEETDTTIQDAALREATEESGLRDLSLDPEPLLLSRHEVVCLGAPTWHLDVQYLVRAPAGSTPVVGAESADLRWFHPDGLPQVDQSVRELVAAAARRQGWPR
jgi:8-oxo-dGTP pyrophosphatase MutT (NUDIX family)